MYRAECLASSGPYRETEANPSQGNGTEQKDPEQNKAKGDRCGELSNRPLVKK